MPASKQLILLLTASAYANAFDFRVEPTCVPNTDVTDEMFDLMLPFLCKFEADAEYDPGTDCTDLPEACKDSVRQKAQWAVSKRYLASQGSSRPGCLDASHLSREVEFPDCVFGTPVPELRIGGLVNSATNARHFAEKILSSNPTACAERKAIEAYGIFGEISQLRVSQVATHGLRTNYDLNLQKIADDIDSITIDCKEPWEPETADEMITRLQANDWELSRKVFDTEECTVLRHYDGGSFAKPHHGGFDGCKAECALEPKCNAFNMGMPFAATVQRTNCDLLECPSEASTLDKFGYVAFSHVSSQDVIDLMVPGDELSSKVQVRARVQTQQDEVEVQI